MENPNVGKMLRPGMKMSACSHSDATLFPIQVKTKEKDISRKEAFQGLSAKKREGELFKNHGIV